MCATKKTSLGSRDLIFYLRSHQEVERIVLAGIWLSTSLLGRPQTPPPTAGRFSGTRTNHNAIYTQGKNNTSAN